MSRDRTLEDTFYIKFPTRAFATGVPTTLAGTPVVSAYVDASTTQITAGITLGVDHDSVSGLNLLTIVATAANGYEAGKDYSLVITTGTVDGVVAVGEVVGEFSLGLSAAFTRLGAPDGASVSADIAVVEGQTDDIGVAGAGLTAINLPNQTMDIVGNITGNLSGSVGSLTGHTVQTGDNFALIGTAGAGLTDLGGMSTGMQAEVESEANDALVAQGLDHLVGAAVVGADITDDSIIAQLVSSSATADWDDFNNTTDSLQAIRDRGDAAWTTGAGGSDRLLMVDTTIASLASQTSFILTAGSADDDAYNNLSIVVEDVSTATQKSVGMVLDYTGSSKTVTLKEALAFTIATTDKVYILAENSLKSTVVNRQLDVTSTGGAGIDWGNVENKTTVNDLSATDIQLCDTVTTLTGHTVQTGDNFARLGAPAGASVSADVAAVKSETALILTDTNELQTDWVNGGRLDLILDARMAESSINTTAGAVDTVTTTTTNTDMVAEPTTLLTTQMSESYASDGIAPTVAQALFAIQQFLQERSTATTTVTVKRIDGSTTAMTFTLDDATTPTSITRAT